MEVTPARLLMACAALFAGIVAVGIVTQAQGSEEVKFSLSKIDLSSLRQRLQREEGIVEQTQQADFADESEPIESEAVEEG